MKEETIRLNPFVYISETSIRFYLIVLAGMLVPLEWALIFGLVTLTIESYTTIFLRTLMLISIFLIFLILIYLNYRRFPKKIIKKSKMKKFDKEKFPDHCIYIEKLYEKYLNPSNIKQPTLMYQPLDFSESAFTFGIKNNTYLGISGGLISKFRKNIAGFRSIFLHEMGHLINKDVEKTYLATSTFQCLFLILLMPVGIFLIYILSIGEKNFERWMILLGGIALFFLLLLGVVYVLRNQLIRLREFFADAKALELDKSPDELIKTLENVSGKHYSKFEILTKFHPNVTERIEVLKNNSRLFTPSLLVAFTIGYFYSIIEMNLSLIKTMILSWNQFILGVWELDVAFRAFISIFIITISMLAISSSFHKSIIKDVFINKVRYFSIATLFNVIKFSLAFSLGYALENLMTTYMQGVFYLSVDDLLKDGPIYFQVWILLAIYFGIALLYLVIFASMLIQRSFSKREAQKNFLIISILASILYICNRYIAIETFHNKPLLIVFFLIFSGVTYLYIKEKDKRLSCSECKNKISNKLEFNGRCPKCNHKLYSWGIYSF